jgi:hypothetical protein
LPDAASVGIGIIGDRTMDMICHENDILSDYGTDIVIQSALVIVQSALVIVASALVKVASAL